MLRELSIDEISIVSGGDGRSQAEMAGGIIQGAIGGALGGAGVGAAIGSFIAPGVGTATGALWGGVVGGAVGGVWGAFGVLAENSRGGGHGRSFPMQIK